MPVEGSFTGVRKAQPATTTGTENLNGVHATGSGTVMDDSDVRTEK